MQVKRIATMGVESVRPDATVRQAAEIMVKGEVGMLPVEHEGKPVGVITDRDIVSRVVFKGRDPEQTLIRDVMSPKAIWIYEDAEVVDAATLMDINQVRRLVVVDHEEKVAGVLSVDDVVSSAPGDAALAHAMNAFGKTSTAARIRRVVGLDSSDFGVL